MEDVEQEAGVRAAGGDGDVDAMCERAKHRMRAPQLEQRQHARLLAEFERFAVVGRRVVERDGGARVTRRHGDPRAADLRHLVHVHLEPLEGRRSGRRIVVQERIERDRAFDRQARVRNPLAEVLQATSALGVRVQLAIHGSRP